MMKYLNKILICVICLVTLMVICFWFDSMKDGLAIPPYKSIRIHPRFKVAPDNPDAIEEHIEELRSKLRSAVNFEMPKMGTFKTAISSQEDYFIKIAAEPNINTLLLNTTTPDEVGPKEFQWIGSQSLCSALLDYKGNMKYSNSCTTDMNKTFIEHKSTQKPRYKIPVIPTGDLEYKTRPRIDYQWWTISSFIHVIHDGIISSDGVVFVGGLQVIPHSCLDTPGRIEASKEDFDKNIKPNINELPRYGEVFVITQFWSNEYYHGNVESLPRLSRYIRFIEKHRDIKIYVACSSFMKSSLETLFPTRNISDLVICDGIRPILAARIYFPEGSPCGISTREGVSQISSEFKKYITLGIPQPPKNYIILIQRTGLRHLVQHNETAFFLSDIAKQYNMDFFIFADYKLPSFSDTRKLFHQARLVVAPHGAGLSNTLYSNPGLFVIEIVCNSPHLNFCYRSLATFLGHHYHGIISKFGCEASLNVDVNEVKEAVQFYIKHIIKA